MRRTLAGKVVLITGASAGIGRDTAVRLAGRGAVVVGCARDGERLRALADAAPAVAVRRCDVAVPADRAALVEGVLASHGRIDALVNNAGLGFEGLLESMPLAQIERLVAVNLVGLIDLSRLVLPSMLARRAGAIVNVSSVAAWVAMPPFTVYSATKYAVDGFTEGLRREVWSRGVRVHSVNPGPVRTEWLPRSQGLEPAEGDPEVRAASGVPTSLVAAAIERCITRPWPRTAAVPRVLGLARLLALPGLRQAMDISGTLQSAQRARS